MGSPQGWGQQLAGHCGVPFPLLDAHWKTEELCFLQTLLMDFCFYMDTDSRHVSSTVCRLMSDSCLVLLEFLIGDVFFLNFDALTRLFLQPLACITEFQLRGRARRGSDGLYITGTGVDGFETDGYGRGWAWKLRVPGGDGFGSDGDGQGSGWTFVPVQFSTVESDIFPFSALTLLVG